MGLFDLPAPLLALVDGVLANLLPDILRLIFWGIVCGWLTMLLYRKISRQDAISALKKQQKVQQQAIADFDGEFEELMPLIRKTLSLGFRQLGLSIGPALLATIPILFIVVWVATVFVYQSPQPGDVIEVTAEPLMGHLRMPAGSTASHLDNGWMMIWPKNGESISIRDRDDPVLTLSSEELHGVIHKHRWWNWLMANPAGYLADDSATDVISVDLPKHQYLGFGPGWLRGSLAVFFSAFLVASIAFKFILRID